MPEADHECLDLLTSRLWFHAWVCRHVLLSPALMECLKNAESWGDGLAATLLATQM